MSAASTEVTPLLGGGRSEDDMELGSDSGLRQMSEEIDIDFELADSEERQQNQDYNIEDAKSEDEGEMIFTSERVQDDVMQDEFYQNTEDNASVPDEILHDVDDSLHDGTTSKDDLMQNLPDVFVTEYTALEPSSPKLDPGPVYAGSPAYDAVQISKETSIEKQDYNDEEQNLNEATLSAALPSDNVEPISPSNHDQEQASDFPEHDETYDKTDTTENEEQNDQQNDHVQQDGENLHIEKDRELHPIIVDYEGTQMSLFPPLDQDTQESFYLLNNEHLANANISTLFTACRTVLADAIGEPDELVMSIDLLGLCIREDSIHAGSTSLIQIVNLYVQLMRLDGLTKPDPLYIHLSLDTRFSKRLSDLQNAVAEGKGYSQLPFWDLKHEEDRETVSQSEEVNEHGDIRSKGPEEKPKPYDDLEERAFSADAPVPAEEASPQQKVQTSALDTDILVAPEDFSNLEKDDQPHNDEINQGSTDSLDINQNEIQSQDSRAGTEVRDLREEEEEDLIDYEDGEETDPQGQGSSESSTLEGDDTVAKELPGSKKEESTEKPEHSIAGLGPSEHISVEGRGDDETKIGDVHEHAEQDHTETDAHSDTYGNSQENDFHPHEVSCPIDQNAPTHEYDDQFELHSDYQNDAGAIADDIVHSWESAEHNDADQDYYYEDPTVYHFESHEGDSTVTEPLNTFEYRDSEVIQAIDEINYEEINAQSTHELEDDARLELFDADSSTLKKRSRSPDESGQISGTSEQDTKRLRSD